MNAQTQGPLPLTGEGRWGTNEMKRFALLLGALIAFALSALSFLGAGWSPNPDLTLPLTFLALGMLCVVLFWTNHKR